MIYRLAHRAMHVISNQQFVVTFRQQKAAESVSRGGG
jgi:hypothetical protein